MSLFHDLLSIKAIRNAALEGRGYFVTPAMCFESLCPQRKDLKEESCKKQSGHAPPSRWTIIEGSLIDLDVLADTHPGGRAALQVAEGAECTTLFRSVHALADKQKLSRWLQSCAVGPVEDFAEQPGVEEAVSGAREKPMTMDSPLARDLRTRVRAHFEMVAKSRGCSVREAAKATLAKWALVLAFWAAYAAAFATWLRGSPAGLLAMPVAGALATFHSFHDASHGALSSRAWANELITYLGFLIAAPHEWRWQHVAGHHVHTNVAGRDPDSKHSDRWTAAEQNGSSRPPRVTVPVVWAVGVPIGLQVLGSVRYLVAWASGGAGAPPRPSVASLSALALHRLVFWFLPLWRFGLMWGLVWSAVPLMIFSLLFMLNTQLAHLNDTTGGEACNYQGDCWYAHQLATSVDFAPSSWLHWLLSGGLNLQVEHHLFPTVDHCHLGALRPIVQEVCSMHSVQLHTDAGYIAGVRSHMRHLYGIAPSASATPPTATSAWYSGRVWHRRRACAARHSKADHSLTYEVEYALLDLDELEQHGRVPGVASGIFSYASPWPSPLRFQPADHLRSRGGGNLSAKDLASSVRRLVSEELKSKGEVSGKEDGSPQLGPVRLLTMPRRLGYVFNPLSVYYCYDVAGKNVVATVLEVSNTPWNEEHLYVLPAASAGRVPKVFHVSPFQPMDTEMEWEAPTPGRELSLRCKISKHGEPFFEAQVHLTQKALTTSSAVWSLLRSPFRTFGVQWAIHVEAWHLFRKGCTFYGHPHGTKTAGSRLVELLFHNRQWLALAACLALVGGLASGSTGAVIGVVTAGLIGRISTRGISGGGKADATSSKGAVDAGQGQAAHAEKQGAGKGSSDSSKLGEQDNDAELVASAREGAEDASTKGRKSVCVVGSGIAGHGAAYFLRDAYDVTLCERDARPGGHAYTATVADGISIDVGFQVFNYANYPLLSRLFDELGVATIESNMSLSVASRGIGDDFEWSSVSLFPTWASLMNPRNWLRLKDVLSFEQAARKALEDDGLGETTLQQWLASIGASDRLRDEYLAPMSAALWSCPSKDVVDFPAVTVLGFLNNHFMLQRLRPRWRTPAGRSQDYVARLRDKLRQAGVKLQAPVEVASLEAKDGGVLVLDVQGRPVRPQPFDHVVLAVHADQAAGIVQRSSLPPEDLRRVESALGGFRYASSLVQVHRDPQLMPREHRCWSAWNAVRLPGDACAVTYWINKLQPKAVPPAGGDIFVTLNAPEGAVKPETELARFQLEHPVLDATALAAQRALPGLQGLAGGRLFFCGAWAGHGFHECGLRSARAACAALGADVSAWPAEHLALGRPSLPTQVLCSRALVPGLQKMVRQGCLRMTFADGSEFEAGDGTGTPVELRVRSERCLWRAILDPGMGLADAYIEGELEIYPDVLDLLQLVLANKPQGDDAVSPLAWSPLQLVTPLAKRYYAMLHARRANTYAGSKRNIEAHYDLSNAMFQMFLSKDMTYSAGIFDAEVDALEKQGPDAQEDFLEVSQYKKLDRIVDTICLEEGDTVLEIGCGWGSMAIRAVQRCPGLKRWVGITLSTQQLELARGRVAAAGLSDRIHIVLCDYRDAAATFGAGYFSKVVSIEMIEAVGHDFLPGYFAAIDECLRPGGLAAIQAICVPDGRYESYRRGSDFIRERIFPGSNLVSLGEVQRACEVGQTALVLHGEPFSVGISYARTLREWRRRFGAHEAEIRKEVSTFGEGFDDRFLRRWHYYFAYCEAGFASGHIDDWQICLRKGANETGRTAARRSVASFNGDALHGANAKLLPEGFLSRPKKALMHMAVGASQRLLDRGLLPDWAVRFGIRLKLRQKIQEEEHGCVERDQAAKLEFVESLKEMPIAICTAEANEQHYEVPAELYHLWLGPRKKYSGCIFPDGAHPRLAARAAELLPAAEERSLEQYVERAELQDGMAILDLGCGWGSLSLFLAKRLPASLVVGVSNSHGQRAWIMKEAEKQGITNLRIVTCDVSQVPLAEAALPALRKERPEAAGFDRGLSVEMFEHMKNYDTLLGRVADVLRPGGRFFVHIFVHTRFAYHFVARTEADWMARYFFAGGTMPSADLLFYFQRSMRLVKHWHVNGKHYQLTAEAWLQNTDRHAERIMQLLRETYPAGTEVMWFNRWRAFFMACAELWGFQGGNEWIVAHYLFQKPSTEPGA